MSLEGQKPALPRRSMAVRFALNKQTERVQCDVPKPAVSMCIVLFEACSAFTRVTACTLALSPYIVTRYPKASAT